MTVLVLDDREIDDVLEVRRKHELDRWDEMWDGVLHMVPPPELGHQGLTAFLTHVYYEVVAEAKRGRIFVQAKLSRTGPDEKNYRVPDISVVLKTGRGRLARQGVARSADHVVEVLSPGDETYKKFDYYASLGVRELLIIHRELDRAELYRLKGKKYQVVAKSPDQISSEVIPIVLRIETRGRTRRLHVQHATSGKTWVYTI